MAQAVRIAGHDVRMLDLQTFSHAGFIAISSALARKPSASH